MTLPEYDEGCTCDLCVMMRNERNDRNKKRIKEEINRVLKEHKQFIPKQSTGTDLLNDSFR
jgi:hypothetical protein